MQFTATLTLIASVAVLNIRGQMVYNVKNFDMGAEMNKEKLKCIRSKTFRNFLFSYIGIFFLTLGIMSMLAMWHIVSNIKMESSRLSKNKLYTVVVDLETQMNAMREMAVKIASLRDFRLDYFQKHKYFEIEMLDRLDDYRGVTDISEFYFLKYAASDTVFTSDGQTISLGIMLRNVFGLKEYAELQETIEASCTDEESQIILTKMQDTMFFIYPLKKYAVSTTGREGSLCFVVKEKDLQDRILKIVGSIGGEINIYYQDFCLLMEKENIYMNEVKENDWLEVISQTGEFKIHFYQNQDSYVAWRNIFSKKEMIVLACTFFLLLASGGFIAYWNFRPMHRIVEKYKNVLNGDLEAEWGSIDTFIESLLQGKERNGKLLQEQFRMFREKTVQLIVSGGYSERTLEYMTLLNIKLEAALFGIVKCYFTDVERLTAEQRANVCYDVEELSDDGMTLYSYWEKDGSLGVLTAVEEIYQMDVVVELLQSLFGAKELSANVNIVGMSRDLKSDFRALNSATAKESDFEPASPKHNRTARKVIEYIKTNCCNCNLSLDMIAEEFQVGTTYLSRIIKQESGMNYKEYLMALRIEEAKELLLNKEVSVMDVCVRCGYSDASYFIKVFQKCTGETPAKYRDEH